MSHDIFESERYRVERVLEILEHAVSRLGARAQVSVSLLKDAVAFLRGAEETAFEAAQEDDSEPTLSACLEYYTAARRLLAAMQETLRDLELGDAAAATRFARSAREYIFLRRDHLRLDDRLFARAQVRGRALDGSREPVELSSLRRPDASMIVSSRRPRFSASAFHQRFPPHARRDG